MRWDVEFLSSFWWLHRVLQGLIWHYLGCAVWAWYVYVCLRSAIMRWCWEMLDTCPQPTWNDGFHRPVSKHPRRSTQETYKCTLGTTAVPCRRWDVGGFLTCFVASAMGLGNCFLHAKLYPKSKMSHERNDTPPKFNMEPENDGFQKESPFPGTSFQVPC